MTDQATHHADEARRILAVLDTGHAYPDEALAAQVHATLAVAERLTEIAALLSRQPPRIDPRAGLSANRAPVPPLPRIGRGTR